MAIARSVAEFLKTEGVAYTVFSHRTAFTAQEEAAVTHTPGREWAKTVVCLADEKPVLAVLPAHYTVDLERLRELAGAHSLRLAREEEFAELYPDCECGAMPPFGPLYGQPVYVERTLSRDPEVVFNAGTHTDAIRMKYADLERVVRPKVGAFGFGPSQ